MIRLLKDSPPREEFTSDVALGIRPAGDGRQLVSVAHAPARRFSEHRSLAIDRVAVAIVNWNSGRSLAACLAALCRQTVAPHRIMVVDNGSTDGSCQGIEQRFPAVEVIRLGENIGFAAANNLISRQANDCRWVAMLNCDAMPRPDWLAELLRAAGRHPDCCVLSSKLLRADQPELLDGAGDLYHASGAAWRRWHGRPDVARRCDIEEVFSPCAAAALYRREALLEVGGLDEGYFCYFEDVDLGFRLRLAGHRCLHVPRSVVYHVGSATTGRRSDFAVYHGHRNMVWTYVKNMPGRLFWLYLPQHLLFNLAALLRFSLRGQTRVIFRSKWHAILGLRAAWRQRRQIQSRCRISAWQLRRSLSVGWLRPYLGRRK